MSTFFLYAAALVNAIAFFETLSKNAIALTRAAAYKKNVDIKNKDLLENGADQFQSFIFEAMAAEEPELYKRVKKFVKSKQKVG